MISINELSRLSIAMLLIAVSINGCKARSPSASLEGGVKVAKDIAPQIVYHIGSYDFLQYGDRVPGTMNDEEFNGRPSTQSQNPYRRGFYVSQHPAYNERYGASYMGSANSGGGPWMAISKLKEECRTKQSSGEIHTIVDSDASFQKYLTSIGKLDFFKTQCGLDQFRDIPENECQQIAFRYYNESIPQKWAIADHWWPGEGFWYIRNKDCIESIKTKPESILEGLATAEEAWGAAPFISSLRRQSEDQQMGQVQFAIVARALAEATSVPSETLKKLFNSAEASDIAEVKEKISWIFQVAYKCSVSQKYEIFREEIRFFLNRVESEKSGNTEKYWEVVGDLAAKLKRRESECPGQGLPVSPSSPVVSSSTSSVVPDIKIAPSEWVKFEIAPQGDAIDTQRLRDKVILAIQLQSVKRPTSHVQSFVDNQNVGVIWIKTAKQPIDEDVVNAVANKFAVNIKGIRANIAPTASEVTQ